MEALSHRIRSLRWGAQARSQPEAFAVRKWLRDELHATLLPTFERAFDVAASRDEVVHISKLELHLEVAAVEEIKDLLPDLIRRRLAELLRSRAAGAASTQQPGGLKTPAGGSTEQETLAFERATAREDRLQALVRYLATGSIPWSFASSDRTVVVEQLRSAAATGELAEILAGWTENAGRQVHFEERLASYFRLLQLSSEDQWAVLAGTFARKLAPERRDELAGVIATLTRDGIEGTSHYQRLWVTAAVLATMDAVAADAEESAAVLGLHEELVENEDLFASPAATATALLRRWSEIEQQGDRVRSSRSEPESVETSVRNRSDEKAPPSQQKRRSRGVRQELSRSSPAESVREEPARGPSPSARPQRRPAVGGRKAARDLAAADGAAAESIEVPGRWQRSAAQEASHLFGDDAGSEEPRLGISSSARPEKRDVAGRPESVPSPSSPGDALAEGSEIPDPAERRSSGSGRKTFRKPAAPQDAPTATGEMSGAPRLPADEPESRSVDESERRQGFSAAAAEAGAESERKRARDRAVTRDAADAPEREREAAGFRPLLREARSARPADTEPRIQSSAVSVFPLVVTQAGLILLHPFLSRFFENLGIKDARQTVLPAASLPRAAALLHWLATGDEEVYEFELGFIKILLGLPPGCSLPVSSGLLHESDREEADALLQAVLEHWTALKSTSAAALRQSFLRRRGLVREEEQGFRLQVEPEPFDVLLGTLPWGLGTVKLSWMKKPIFTDWPTP